MWAPTQAAAVWCKQAAPAQGGWLAGWVASAAAGGCSAPCLLSLGRARAREGPSGCCRRHKKRALLAQRQWQAALHSQQTGRQAVSRGGGGGGGGRRQRGAAPLAGPRQRPTRAHCRPPQAPTTTFPHTPSRCASPAKPRRAQQPVRCSWQAGREGGRRTWNLASASAATTAAAAALPGSTYPLGRPMDSVVPSSWTCGRTEKTCSSSRLLHTRRAVGTRRQRGAQQLDQRRGAARLQGGAGAFSWGTRWPPHL